MKSEVFFFLTFFVLICAPNMSFSCELKLCGVEWPPFTYELEKRKSGGGGSQISKGVKSKRV